ncbi:hypothetical protein PILCRDRAFT_607199 [Piloderma croceum F 1598]|uniref:F-box domain-containing protein n=1 Tax=Piloderma croceum (strain F 1598) TaxID=765440 RepID=A0A0C3BKW3_PILCF|nr:hypothetical protein PILCRDRAFT_607199 [Piloderma croceum F 1598]
MPRIDIVEVVSPFPPLPLELVRHILGFAAAASRHASRNICLVAPWARDIALPYLFHTVVLNDKESYIKFRKYLHSPESYIPSNFDFKFSPTVLVRNLWVEGIRYDPRCIFPIYQSCDNLTHLALSVDLFNWLLNLSTPGLSEISDRASSRSPDLQVTFLSSMLGVIDTPSPIYKRVTHICLTSASVVERHISSFTRLSHISMPCRGMSHRNQAHLRRFLGLKTLKMVVVVVLEDVVRTEDREDLKGWVRGVRQTDSRVYMVERHSSRIREDWENEMRGGDSMWDMAVRYTAELG